MVRVKRAVLILISQLLIITTLLTGCDADEPSTSERLAYFSRAIEKGDLWGINLSIYYMGLTVFTPAPISIKHLMNWSGVDKYVIDGYTLQEHSDLLKRMIDTTLVPVGGKLHEDARIYYVFETEGGAKLFDVCLSSVTGNFIVNGVEVEKDNVFWDVLIEFLPEDKADEIRRMVYK